MLYLKTGMGRGGGEISKRATLKNFILIQVQFPLSINLNIPVVK